MPIYIERHFFEKATRYAIDNNDTRDIEIQAKHSSIPISPDSTSPFSPTGLSG